MTPQVLAVTKPEEIQRCAPVLRELRPALTEEQIIAQVQQQMSQGIG